MSGFTRDSPQISANQHQLDFAPYALGPYNAQWNAPGLLHDMYMLCSSRILGEMEVEEPWLALWLPLNYQVDNGASQHRTPKFGVNPTSFFAAKFLLFFAKGGVRHWKCGRQALWLI